MGELLAARQRYIRMLDALGTKSRIDRDLRSELNAAIDALDQKIHRLQSRPARNVAAISRVND